MVLVSGFTFIKNGLGLGYPIRESVESIEPLCDEVIINVGFEDQSLGKDDGTYEYLRDHFKHSKFKFVKSWWDPAKTKGGAILAEQTQIALSHCSGKFCQYIQGDEAIHEDDLTVIHDALLNMDRGKKTEGLVFNYLHFYGNVNILKHTRTIYRREVRAIRNHNNIKSWRDAQGFRHADESKLRCVQIPARIFHYGWARQEKVMREKARVFDKFYHGQDFQAPEFNYERIWGLKRFEGTHPRVMQNWIEKNRNTLNIMDLPLRWEWKNVGLAVGDAVEGLTGYRIGEYKNFKLER